jgi:cyclopropane fatty-acyl-phospholipid synthase-like methyltransferase
MNEDDAIARMRAEMDQAKEGLKEVAGSLWTFYSALCEEGFADEAALEITITWFTQLLSNEDSS